MDRQRFNGCKMSHLVFEEPSHLARLPITIPLEVAGQLDVPDSLTTLEVYIYEDYRGPTVLNFGRESRLKDFEAPGLEQNAFRLFLRLTEPFLKGVRDFHEFKQEPFLHRGPEVESRPW
jgi:hypothetical protein